MLQNRLSTRLNTTKPTRSSVVVSWLGESARRYRGNTGSLVSNRRRCLATLSCGRVSGQHQEAIFSGERIQPIWQDWGSENHAGTDVAIDR